VRQIEKVNGLLITTDEETAQALGEFLGQVYAKETDISTDSAQQDNTRDDLKISHKKLC